jgi:5-oxoprolinase (ATP-hydrolysing)
VVVTNHPAFGGSHLPDVTLLTPLFAPGEDRPIAILANRAHHAEIGGIRPGSMAPSARCLAEEGVAIAPTRLIEGGEPRWERIEAIFREATFPSRNLDDNLADLAAQIAANHGGAERAAAFLREIGAPRFRELLEAMSRHGLATLRNALPSLLPGPRRARVELDDGTPIEVSLRLEARGDRRSPSHLVVDFSGSGAEHPRNLNAPIAIVHAAVLYALRLLVGRSIPLHEGLMQAVDLRVPAGILNPTFSGDPRRDPAVAAGNTETSQRIVECLLAAFGTVAASQGTMNNTLLGNERFGMYETVCGGSGAGPGFDGAPAVHTHMTNTRIGDPEFVEARYPIRIVRFEIRRDSGGDGRHRGGDGVRRVYEALAPLSACVVAEHRREGPPGANGGEPGLAGEQFIERADGARESATGAAEIELKPGDRLVLLTPGGGGWGAAP